MRAVASLPMYPQPRAKAAWVTLWDHVSRHLRAVGLPAPACLAWPVRPEVHWAAPDLFLSQTCARPFGQWVHRTASVVGAFDFGLPGCAPGEYCSVILSRRDDTRDWRTLRDSGRVAISGFDSQSGYAAWAQIGDLPAAPLVTGSHAASVQAVAARQADVALVDAVSWRYLKRLPGAAVCVCVRGTTPATPGLPLITARRHLAPALRIHLAESVERAPEGPKRWLGLRRFVPCDGARYLPGFALPARPR